jgi:hypothetical protein
MGTQKRFDGLIFRGKRGVSKEIRTDSRYDFTLAEAGGPGRALRLPRLCVRWREPAVTKACNSLTVTYLEIAKGKD